MAKDDTLDYLITASWKGQKATADAKKGLDDVGKSGDDAGRGLSNAQKGADFAAGAFKKLIAGGILLTVGNQLASFVQQSIGLASDVEEATGKFNVVFANTADQVRGAVDEFAKSVGRSKYEMREWAGTIGDTLKPMGFAEEAAGELATQIVALGTDLGSFNNMPMDEALQRLKSTLIGNHENALAFGVIINENTLKAELAANGWDKLTGAQLEQAKVQARINLLMAGTTDAQGDAIRTADSYANKTAAMAAAMTDLSVSVGQLALPAALALVEALTGVVERLQILADVQRDGGQIIDGIVDKNIAQAESVDDLVDQYYRLQKEAHRWGGLAAQLTGTSDDLARNQRKVVESLLESAGSADEYIAARQRIWSETHAMSASMEAELRLLYATAQAMREQAHMAAQADENMLRYVYVSNEAEAATTGWNLGLRDAYERMGEMTRANRSLREAIEATREGLRLKREALTSTFRSDYLTFTTTATLAEYDWSAAVYETAVAFGASTDQLVLLGVTTNQYTKEQAAAAANAAFLKAEQDRLTQGYIDGKISAQELMTALTDLHANSPYRAAVEVEISEARQKLREIRGELDALDGRRVTSTVSVTTGAAEPGKVSPPPVLPPGQTPNAIQGMEANVQLVQNFFGAVTPATVTMAAQEAETAVVRAARSMGRL